MKEEILKEACSFVKKKTGNIPLVAMILGSGLGPLAKLLENPVSIHYRDIPGFPVSTAPGHASKLVFGKLKGIDVLIFQGRFHRYEGYSMDQITFPVRFIKELGCKILILTNAAGGIRRSFSPGDLMLISDHLNFSGQNPLTGLSSDSSGIRFPDISRAYTPVLQDLMRKISLDLDIDLKEGTYAWMNGPSFETPAEIKMLRISGADAVGMSTVPEVIMAVHSGLDVVAVSCISNMASGILNQPITADEVIETGLQIQNKFSSLLCNFISQCGEIYK